MSLGAFHEHLCSGGVLGGALGLEKLSEAVPLSQVEPVAPNSWSMFTFGREEAVTFAPVPKETSETLFHCSPDPHSASLEFFLSWDSRGKGM